MHPGIQTAMDNIYGSGNTLGQVAELQKQLAEAQSTRFGLDRRLSTLCRQMSDDGSSKSVTFEDALNSHWDCQEAAMASVRQARVQRVGSSSSSSMLCSQSNSCWRSRQ
jgi:hypothetical protein